VAKQSEECHTSGPDDRNWRPFACSHRDGSAAEPRSEWGNEEVQVVYKKEDESMFAGALAMGVIFDSANNFYPKKQFALFLDIGKMDDVGSSSTVESSIQTVTFHDQMDRMVAAYSMFTPDMEESARAVMSRTIAANPSLTGGVFALLLTVCTRYYNSTSLPT